MSTVHQIDCRSVLWYMSNVHQYDCKIVLHVDWPSTWMQVFLWEMPIVHHVNAHVLCGTCQLSVNLIAGLFYGTFELSISLIADLFCDTCYFHINLIAELFCGKYQLSINMTAKLFHSTYQSYTSSIVPFINGTGHVQHGSIRSNAPSMMSTVTTFVVNSALLWWRVVHVDCALI